MGSAQGSGFFETPEVSLVLAMLTVMDNPHKDIPLIAVLRSAAFGFTPDELSFVRAARRDADFFTALEDVGQMPLPPYIKEKLENKERYQTVYSHELGSAAAPTAGLHFTEDMLDDLRKRGIKTAFVTLHVGLGTFRPVKEDNVLDHKMHSEHYYLPKETADLINQTKAEGGRVIAVGTTTCRTLEKRSNVLQ